MINPRSRDAKASSTRSRSVRGRAALLQPHYRRHHVTAQQIGCAPSRSTTGQDPWGWSDCSTSSRLTFHLCDSDQVAARTVEYRGNDSPKVCWRLYESRTSRHEMVVFSFDIVDREGGPGDTVLHQHPLGRTGRGMGIGLEQQLRPLRSLLGYDGGSRHVLPARCCASTGSRRWLATGRHRTNGASISLAPHADQPCSRRAQLRVPVGWTNRYRPLPPACRPGGAERTKAAESALSGRRARRLVKAAQRRRGCCPSSDATPASAG